MMWLAVVLGIATPTPTPVEAVVYRKLRVGTVVCGELGRGANRWHVRGCKPLEDLVSGTLPTATPTRAPTPRPTGTPWQPVCPSRCPSGTSCDAIACAAFGDCACR